MNDELGRKRSESRLVLADDAMQDVQAKRSLFGYMGWGITGVLDWAWDVEVELVGPFALIRRSRIEHTGEPVFLDMTEGGRAVWSTNDPCLLRPENSVVSPDLDPFAPVARPANTNLPEQPARQKQGRSNR